MDIVMGVALVVAGVGIGAFVSCIGVWLGQRTAVVERAARGGAVGSDIAPTAGYSADDVEGM